MISNVLVALDNSVYADKVMEKALGVAKACGAKLTGLSVIDYSSIAWASGMGSVVIPQIMDAMKEGFQACLDRCSSMAKEAGVTFEQVILTGSAARTIVEYAGKKSVDLIVVGHMGKTTVETLLLGSVAYKVTNQARCSVLVVK